MQLPKSKNNTAVKKNYQYNRIQNTLLSLLTAKVTHGVCLQCQQPQLSHPCSNHKIKIQNTLHSYRKMYGILNLHFLNHSFCTPVTTTIKIGYKNTVHTYFMLPMSTSLKLPDQRITPCNNYVVVK